MIRMVTLAVIAWMTTISAFATPIGTYTVDGIGPNGGKAYSGVVSVEQVGEKYLVVWTIQNKKREGVALGGAVSQGTFMVGPAHPDDLMLAIGYQDGKVFGTATMFLQAHGGYEGFLVQSDGNTAGQETWTPR